MTRVPVLLYHSVSDNPSPAIASFALAPEAFARQLDAVVASGRSALTVSQYANALAAGALPEYPVVITFDDGYADFLESALPELIRRGIPSTLYVTTGFLEGRNGTANRPRDRMLRWSQLPELVASGVEIGGHSHSHLQLDTLSRARAREEVLRCKTLLEDELAGEVATFAYPHGYSGPAVRSLVREAGYRSAAGVANAFSSERDDPFALARLMVRDTTTDDEVKGWLRGVGAPVAPAHDRVRTVLWRRYRRSRALITGRPGSAFGC